MRWQVLFGLVLCNTIWSTVPLAGKHVLEIYSPMEAAWFRYLSAFLMVLILAIFAAWKNPAGARPSLRTTFGISTLPWVVLVGLTTFYVSPVSQYFGLQKSTASANTLIVAIEPLVTAGLAWLFLREHLSKIQFFGFTAALGGFLLLSNLDPLNPIASLPMFNTANFFLLLMVPSECLYTVVCRKLSGRALSELQLFGGAITIGILVLTATLMLHSSLPDFSKLTWNALLAILWLGPIANTLTYLYWSKALQEAPVAPVALTLFVQPILGTLWGHVFLYETFTFWQTVGAVFILSAQALQSFYHRKKRTI